MTKELSPLEQVLVDTIQKSTAVGGEIYDATKAGLAKGIDFAQQQIPDVLHQLLMWNLAESTIYILIGIGMLYVAYKACTAWLEEIQELGIIITVIFGVLGSAMIISNLLTAVKILIAPKLFLIEYATTLLKQLT